MKRTFSSKPDRILRNPLNSRNWETDIHKVLVEPCAEDEDPLGYRAVFLLSRESANAQKKTSFAVGASFLAQRGRHLEKAGYSAPMTRRAIAMVEDRIGPLSTGAASPRIFVEEMA